ncbi:unnamed protein product [Lactuca saligna]|uniref:Uncharacterized protein n=1 Tax=Lactuca saligna TaxID=75948 RepID=A0AA36E4P2_LACSI|nr:unnamed protein product [Lactuca saligna]
MVVITQSTFQPKMPETRRVEADLQKENVVNIPDVDETIDDRPIPDISDQSETNYYEGFLDLGFMPPVVVLIVSLNVIYPDSYFQGRFLKELIVILMLIILIPKGSSIFEKGRLPPQRESMMLKLEVLLLTILQHLLLPLKEISFFYLN